MWKNYFYSQKYFVNFAVNILNFIKRSLLKYYIINKIKKKYYKNNLYYIKQFYIFPNIINNFKA